jgi:hypothetical protein
MIHKLDAVSDLIGKGQIKLGITRMELRGMLGPPDEEGGTSRKYKVSSIYKFGDIQFVFPDARTAMEAKAQGLLYIYVDDDLDGIEEPLFLLK